MPFKKLKLELIAIVWLSISVFIGLALWSYHPQDTSLSSLSWGQAPLNWCGVLGSFLSDFLLKTFGLAAWFIPVGALFLSLKIFVNQKYESDYIKSLWGLSLLLISAALIQIYFVNNKFYQGSISSGGILGEILAKGFVLALNRSGAMVIFWSAWLMSFVMFFEQSMSGLLSAGIKTVYFVIRHTINKLNLFFFGLWAGVKKLFKVRKEKSSYSLNHLFLSENTTAKASVKNKDAFLLGKSIGKNKEIDSKDLFESKNETERADDTENAEAQENTLFGQLKYDQKTTVLNKTKKAIFRSQNRTEKVENWTLPNLNLIEDPPPSRVRIDTSEIKDKAKILKEKLSLFGVTGEIVNSKAGPAVTLYEFRPESRVKISKITELADDLTMALSSQSLRIIAPIPGRDVVGVETANKSRETVYLKDMLAEDRFWSDEFMLPMALGRKVDGGVEIVDLRKMPHLLVAGTTGSGKSVFTVSTIIGLLYKHSPKTLKLILIDPKHVDLAAFESVPHLAMPIVTEARQAVMALKWAVNEMEKRYRSMSQFGARGIETFNETASKLNLEQKKEHEQANFDFENTPGKRGEAYYYEPQPYLVIVVEEFADLMTVDKGNVEQSVIRLAQKARACGIHLVLCLQSPRKEFVTGAIKSNIPGRIAFKAASSMESRIILDEGGAERLLASGDMLYRGPGSAHVIRHHGPFLKDDDIKKITQFWSDQGEPDFSVTHLNEEANKANGSDSNFGLACDDQDERHGEVLDWIQTQKEVSASLIQRRFALGYPRAARLIESFEKEGVVGPANGSKPRTVLIHNLREL